MFFICFAEYLDMVCISRISSATPQILVVRHLTNEALPLPNGSRCNEILLQVIVMHMEL